MLLLSFVLLSSYTLTSAIPGSLLYEENGSLYSYELKIESGFNGLKRNATFYSNGHLHFWSHHNVTGLSISQKDSDYNYKMKPFEIIYDKNGQVDYILTEHESELVRNLKKALAANLQIDFICLKEKENIYKVTEGSIYGKRKVYYDVRHKNNIKITKTEMEPEIFWKKYFNNKDTLSDLIKVDNTNRYIIEKKDEKFYLQNIDIEQHIFLNNTKLQTLFFKIHLNINFVEARTYENQKMSSNKDNLIVNYLPDNGPVDKEKILNLLKNIPNIFLKLNQSPDIIDKLLNLMSGLKLSELKEIYISSNKNIFFLEILPLIGTKSSVEMIVFLINNNYINDDTAIKIIRKLSTINHPTQEILEELETILLDNNSTLKEAVVFTFATILDKTITSNQITNEAMDKYLQLYIDKIQNDTANQFIFINGLYNIKSANLTNYLLPIIQGEVPTVDRHIQYLAIVATYAEGLRNPSRTLEIYWPIMTNRSLHLELRIGAYTMISSSSFTKNYKIINDYMATEPSIEFRHFHYTFVQYLTKTTDSYYQEYKNVANKFFDQVPKPMGRQLSGYYLIDYIDPESGSGIQMTIMIISTETSKAVYIDFANGYFGLMNHDSIWIKVDEHENVPDQSWYDDAEFLTIDSILSDQIIQSLATLEYQEGVHVEAVLLHNDYVIFNQYMTQNNIELLTVLKEMFPLFKNENYLDVSYEAKNEIQFPNILGIPTKLYFKINSFSDSFTKFKSQENKTDLTYDFKLNYNKHISYGIEFKNISSNIWEGVENVQKFSFKFPLNISFNGNYDGEHPNYINLFSNLTLSLDKENELLEIILFNQNNAYYINPGLEKELYFTLDGVPQGNLELNENTEMLDKFANFVTDAIKIIHPFISKHNPKLIPHIKNLLRVHNIKSRLMNQNNQKLPQLELKIKPKFDELNLQLNSTINMFSKEIFASRFYKNITAVLEYSTKNNYDVTKVIFDINFESNPSRSEYILNLTMKCQNLEENNTFCIYGEKKWLPNKVAGIFKLSKAKSDSCFSNVTILDVTMKGEQSREQKEEKLQNCDYKFNSNLPPIILEECLAKQCSYRKYKYDIHLNIQDILNKSHLEIETEFPMYDNDFKMEIRKNQKMVDVKYLTQEPGWAFLGLYPDNAIYHQHDLFLRNMGFEDTYIFHKNTFDAMRKANITGLDEFGIDIVPETKYYVPHRSTAEQKITAREIEIGKMVLDIWYNNKTINLLDEKMLLNGSSFEISDLAYYAPWFSVVKLSNTYVVYLPQIDYYIDYNGDYVRLSNGIVHGHL